MKPVPEPIASAETSEQLQRAVFEHWQQSGHDAAVDDYLKQLIGNDALESLRAEYRAFDDELEANLSRASVRG